MEGTEKGKAVKVWEQAPGVEAAKVIQYIEKLEKEGWTIFQLFHTNEIAKQDGKVLQLNNNQMPKMVLVVHALCYKWIFPKNEYAHKIKK